MSSGNSLEARIQRLEDLEAIRALTNAYHAGINRSEEHTSELQSH